MPITRQPGNRVLTKPTAETGCRQNGNVEKVSSSPLFQRPISLDWREALGSRYSVNRFVAEVLEFFNLHGYEVGVETTWYIRLAARTVATGTRQLSDVFRLVYRCPQSTVRQKFSAWSVLAPSNRCPVDSLREIESGMKGKVTEPVLNRLVMLMGDDYLAAVRNTFTFEQLTTLWR